MRSILSIEYEYVRIYVNSLSLQAVVERCTNAAAATSAAATHNNGHAHGHGHNHGPLSPETQNYYRKLPLFGLGGFNVADQEYVRQVVDGSRNLLETVVRGLLPGDYLKHAPVRTYFRIISGAMFLLKTFALGATKSDVELSIGLMDSAVDALRTCVVDDVHLGIRFADLLETLTSRLRSRFISAPTGPLLPGAVGGPLGGGDGLLGGRARSPLNSMDQPDYKRQKMDGSASSIRDWQAGTPNFGVNAGLESASATPIDPTTHGIMPSTPFSTGGGGPGSTYSTSANDINLTSDTNNLFNTSSVDWTTGNEMWYLPPGAAFFQNVSDQTITQTAEGVNVGGLDLLDYMTLDNFPMDSSGF